MAGSVGSATTAVTAAVKAAASSGAADDVGKLAPVLVAAKGGMTGTGWLGMGAGAAGIAITLLDAWKDSMGSQRGVSADTFVNKATVAIGGGAVLLTIGEKTAVTSGIMRNGLRSAGIALVLAGFAGAIAGAMQTFGNPLKEETEAAISSQSQAPKRFGTVLPPAPANLAGVEVASADVIGEGRKLERVPVYVDTNTAKAMPDGATLSEAIGQARASAQSDESYRSHAVIKTDDGKFWTVRLLGGLDQVDGPKYSDATKYDTRYDPQIGRRQQALQAIAGVEGHFAFPDGMEATAPQRYPKDIPWVVPTPAGTKPTTTPAPTATPTTPAPSAATPAATAAATPTTTAAPANGG